MDGLVLIVQLTGLLIDNLRTRNGILDTLQQRMLMLLSWCATIVAIEQFNIVGIGTKDSQRLDAL